MGLAKYIENFSPKGLAKFTPDNVLGEIRAQRSEIIRYQSLKAGAVMGKLATGELYV